MGLDNPLHIAFLLVILLLVFGAKRLPELGKGLGEGLKGFKEGLKGISEPSAPAATTQQSAPAAPPSSLAPMPVTGRPPAEAEGV